MIAFRRFALIALAILTIVVWLPFAGLAASIYVSSTLHCAVDEASVHPCIVSGIDIGPALNYGFTGGWLMLTTAPAMLATSVVWITLACVALVNRIRLDRRKN